MIFGNYFETTTTTTTNATEYEMDNGSYLIDC